MHFPAITRLLSLQSETSPDLNAATQAAGDPPQYDTLIEVATFALGGFFIVMLTLCVLWFFTAMIGLYFKSRERKALAAVHVPYALDGDNMEDYSDDRELAAVIAAAVSAVVNEPHQIVSIRQQGSDWSREGRRSIFESHRVR